MAIREEKVGTLGHVLYGSKQAPCELEGDWAALVQAIASGDQLALHALYERTRRPVFTLAVRITGSRETAEEITLDVFHDVWRRASYYDARNGTVLGWIMNQARSRSIDRLRFDARKKRNDSSLYAVPAPSDAPDSADVLERKQQNDSLRDAILRLAPEERSAIESAFFAELSHAEVAARLKEPLGTVKTRIRSGLGKLRRTLSRKWSES